MVNFEKNVLDLVVEETVEKEGKVEIIKAFDSASIESGIENSHPLKTSWVLWIDQAGKQTKQNWSQNLKEVIVIDTIEKFWAVFNNIPKCSQLSLNSSYYFFREGTRPEWEDENNKNGGRWTAQIKKTEQDSRLDNYWIKLILSSIGESSGEFSDEICGCVISIKKLHNRLSLWTRNANNTRAYESLGTMIKNVLDFRTDVDITYIPHDGGKAGGKNSK